MSNVLHKTTVVPQVRKNRLIITLRGVISKKQVDTIYTDIRFGVSELAPDFDVITNLTECRIAYLSTVGTYKKIVDFLKEKQVGRIVRVVGGANLIARQFVRVSKVINSYDSAYVETMEEAELLLEQSEKVEEAA